MSVQTIGIYSLYISVNAAEMNLSAGITKYPKNVSDAVLYLDYHSPDKLLSLMLADPMIHFLSSTIISLLCTYMSSVAGTLFSIPCFLRPHTET